jgi:hypothetical protein
MASYNLSNISIRVLSQKGISLFDKLYWIAMVKWFHPQ